MRGNSAEKSREQREPKRVGLPIEECGPIQTAAEQALFFMVYQDPACKNADGSDNFLVMSGKFNCHYGRQVSHTLEQQLASCAGSAYLISKDAFRSLLYDMDKGSTHRSLRSAAGL